MIKVIGKTIVEQNSIMISSCLSLVVTSWMRKTTAPGSFKQVAAITIGLFYSFPLSDLPARWAPAWTSLDRDFLIVDIKMKWYLIETLPIYLVQTPQLRTSPIAHHCRVTPA